MSSSKDGGALPKAERREALAQPPNLVRSSRTRPSSTVISDDSTDESEYHDAPHVLDDNEAEGSDEAGENSDKEAQHVSPKHTAYYTDSSEDSKSDRHVHYDEYESLYELVLENEDIRNTIRAMASHIEDDNNIRYRRYSRGEKSARRVVEGHEKKRMFICCDGTWQNASGTVTPMTNVAKLARAVDRLGCDPYMPESRGGPANERGSQHRTHIGLVRQIVYYSSGIGGQSALHIERGYSGLTGKGAVSIPSFDPAFDS
ncbi:hypothetical protein CGLO_02042 [Colletotrichum gloeosporioides Cg-14]|uniref:T6SS Phospholipase effector Tle1-like catalytic domain-containing protein n=1 Tax=Colletotrichum gloeosporioides (strain Cg-14) TaxID=1237896 RepID=T0L004_COLGC|nr:hypothetical protein CGLO_02042 [Colletotrichum gloeosporioides Cg-14]